MPEPDLMPADFRFPRLSRIVIPAKSGNPFSELGVWARIDSRVRGNDVVGLATLTP
jgi:hypothetical protein